MTSQDDPGVPDSARSRVPATAAIVAIGSEMLGPLRLDTNSQWLSARLEELGIPVVRKSIVGDELDELKHSVTVLEAYLGYDGATG